MKADVEEPAEAPPIPPPRRAARIIAATLVVGVASVIVMFVLAVLIGRATEGACGQAWTHIEGELFPPSLRCIDESAGVPIVEDHSDMAWAITIGATAAAVLSIGVLALLFRMFVSGRRPRFGWLTRFLDGEQ